MAQLWTTGPALVYVGLGAAGTPVFLGTAERKPIIDVDHVWQGIPNDIGGSVPFDHSYQGQHGFIRMDLGRWNEPVLTAVRSVPNPAGVPGLNPFGDVGAIANQEGLTYGVWVVFPNASKAAYAGMVPGYRFVSCMSESFGERPGTGERTVPLLWHAQRAFDPRTYGFLLYDSNVAGVPSPD